MSKLELWRLEELSLTKKDSLGCLAVLILTCSPCLRDAAACCISCRGRPLYSSIPQNWCLHAHLHTSLHSATHHLVLKLLQNDCTHGVVVLRQQVVIDTTFKQLPCHHLRCQLPSCTQRQFLHKRLDEVLKLIACMDGAGARPSISASWEHSLVRSLKMRCMQCD